MAVLVARRRIRRVRRSPDHRSRGGAILGAGAGNADRPQPPPSSLPVVTPFAAGDQPSAKGYLGDLRLIKSTFDDSFKSGKDPFFPNTERSKGGSQTNAVELVKLSDLVLKGLSYSTSKRTAIINRYTLEEGETRTIRVNDRVYEVQCIKVREKSAVIGIRNQEHELFLRPGPGL